MDNGRLVACGAPQQLMADQAVKKLFVRSHDA